MQPLVKAVYGLLALVVVLLGVVVVLLVRSPGSQEAAAVAALAAEEGAPAGSGEEAAGVPSAAALATVTKVIDGDTITVRLPNNTTDTVRLIGLDAPETAANGGECFGKEATEALSAALVGHKVMLEGDPTQGERDKYDRLLAYVYRDDGLFLNQHLIEEGLAKEYTYNKAYAYQKEFKAAQTAAQKAKVGLWASNACSKNTPAATSTPTPAPQVSPQTDPVPTSAPANTQQPTATSEEKQQATPPATQPTSAPSNKSWNCTTNTYNCSDFSSHEEAQSVFEMCGGTSNDVHKLDRDKDGLVCETL